MRCRLLVGLVGVLLFPSGVFTTVDAQQPPYDVAPEIQPPYYRVRFEASAEEGELAYPVKYTLWVPEGIDLLRGIVVHQHGCGEGSCKSGLTGAFDLHWQALARKHQCALLAPSYEQPADADCQQWCDPRNGSDAAFRKGLRELAELCGHPELSSVPWTLWGHSGGGHWAGGMVMLHPKRVVAAWLRSGVPFLEPDPQRPDIRHHDSSPSVLKVPLMCNLGTREGVSDQNGRFARVWPSNKRFFERLRKEGALVAVAVDPLTAHECGNQRYLAIPWLDACLAARLPNDPDGALREMPSGGTWLAEPTGTRAFSASGEDRPEGPDSKHLGWLPNRDIAQKWMQYVNDTAVADGTAPPVPDNLVVEGDQLSWTCRADLESGLQGFEIERDGEVLSRSPATGQNRFGRPLFQGLQYSDTPLQPLVQMQFRDEGAELNRQPRYRVRAINTAGLRSDWSRPAER